MKQFLSILLLILLFNSCKKELCNCTESTGNISTESRALTPFSEIELYNNVDLVLHTDTFYHVSITAGSNLINGITADVNNGILQLRNKNRCNWLRSYSNTFVADVYVKSLNHFSAYDSLVHISINDASGNIDFADVLKSYDSLQSHNFRLDCHSGTGDYHLKLDCNVATLALHTGSANVYATGYVRVDYVYDVSYGKMDLRNLESDAIYVRNNSTNDLYINAHHLIEATIDYIGNIYYRGDTVQLVQKINGSGKLIHIN